jgi:hypothetical protein
VRTSPISVTITAKRGTTVKAVLAVTP